MIRRIVTFCTTLLFSMVAAATNGTCPLTYFYSAGYGQVPMNTLIHAGPTMYTALTTVPGVLDAVVAARDEWNKTNAAGRFGGYGGMTASDCPAGVSFQNGEFQLGAYPFSGSTCQTLLVQGFTTPGLVLAFTDWYKDKCADCGTRSISINLNVAWSADPQPNQSDLRSVLTHELGHVLGLAHMSAGVCDEQSYGSCTLEHTGPGFPPNASNFIETMQIMSLPGETCLRDLTQHDIDSANSQY